MRDVRALELRGRKAAMPRILPLITAALGLLALLVPGAARPEDSPCVHTDAVFYSTDSVNLAARLHAAPSNCADYYISLIPGSDNRTPTSVRRCRRLRRRGNPSGSRRRLLADVDSQARSSTKGNERCSRGGTRKFWRWVVRRTELKP